VEATHGRLLGEAGKKGFATVRHKNVIHVMCKKQLLLGERIYTIYDSITCFMYIVEIAVFINVSSIV